ncbi:hypothetical protein HUK45_01265 [Limosilactobacillus sp. c9Ua_26_M]|uniref:Molecular chaperone n=1 Tax=Limosilactobacillus urinaemulieris TaxID=2742600 RepID=A0ABR8ZHZ9_9LACO|nr:phage tail tube assembly chaperone [Limosilactobacillus urinaemulieris]MBD8084905.1 hypothetical protein [Limosilactobacillus urinaemulieris]
MVVKLNTTKIGLKKPVNVHTNLTNVDKADEMMIAMLSLNVDMDESEKNSDEEDSVKQSLTMLTKERQFTKKSLEFLQDVLNLSDKQITIVKDHADFTILGEYLSYVCNRIKGVPESAYEKETKKAAPKEQSASSEEQ